MQDTASNQAWQAMSQRTGLISSITSSLTTIYGHTTSPVLKTKIEQAVQLSLDESILLAQDSSDDEAHHQDNLELRNRLKLRLWKMLQKALFRRQRSLRLKPISERNREDIEATIEDSISHTLSPMFGVNSTPLRADDEECEMLLEAESLSLDDILDGNAASEPEERMSNGTLLEDEEDLPSEGLPYGNDLLDDNEYEHAGELKDLYLAADTDHFDQDDLLEESIIDEVHDLYCDSQTNDAPLDFE